jgi:hypothetical protein
MIVCLITGDSRCSLRRQYWALAHWNENLWCQYQGWIWYVTHSMPTYLASRRRASACFLPSDALYTYLEWYMAQIPKQHYSYFVPYLRGMIKSFSKRLRILRIIWHTTLSLRRVPCVDMIALFTDYGCACPLRSINIVPSFLWSLCVLISTNYGVTSIPYLLCDICTFPVAPRANLCTRRQCQLVLTTAVCLLLILSTNDQYSFCCLSLYLFISASIYLSIYLCSYLSMCIYISLYSSISISLSIDLSMSLSILSLSW